MLDTFGIEGVDTQKVTSVGICALARAVVDGSPNLGDIMVNEDYHDIVKDMLRAGEGNVNVAV